MPLDSDLRSFEVDSAEPFARFTRFDSAPGWVAFPIAFGLFIVAVAALWTLSASRILEPFGERSVRIGALAFVIVFVTSMMLFDRRRSGRIQRRLLHEGLASADTIFAIRTRWGRNMRFGTALAFLPGEIVVVHGTVAHPLTRIDHRSISSIEHLDRAGVNHVAMHIDGAAYLFSLWPSALLPRPAFGSNFMPPRASARASGSNVLREAIIRSGIPFTQGRIL